MILLALAALTAAHAAAVSPRSPAHAAAIARCTAGHKDACGPALTETGRAFLLESGAERPEDLAAAEKACALGVPVGCALFGTAEFRAARTPAESAAGRKLVDKACAAKNEIACSIEATLLLGGDAAERSRGRPILDKTCEASKKLSCVVLAGMLASGDLAGVVRDQGRAFQLDARACEAGEVAGCRSAGYALHEGVGAARDLGRAAAFYGKSCEGGDGYGCSDLGLMALAGEGAPKDPPRAEAAFRRGCELGEPEACRNFSAAAHAGTLGPTNSPGLFEIDSVACNGGASAACLYLFQRYAHGDGVPQSDDKAVSFVGRACQFGDTAGCELGAKMNGAARTKCAANDLGGCYLLALTQLYGVGTAVDGATARTLLNALCAKGAKPACDKFATLGP